MTYPFGNISEDFTLNEINSSDFSPRIVCGGIVDNHTTVNHMGMKNSVGYQISLLQNFVNDKKLGRDTTPVDEAFITNIISSGTMNITSANNMYLYGNYGMTIKTGSMYINKSEDSYMEAKESYNVTCTNYSTHSTHDTSIRADNDITLSATDGVNLLSNSHINLSATQINCSGDIICSNIPSGYFTTINWKSIILGDSGFSNTVELTSTSLNYNSFSTIGFTSGGEIITNSSNGLTLKSGASLFASGILNILSDNINVSGYINMDYTTNINSSHPSNTLYSSLAYNGLSVGRDTVMCELNTPSADTISLYSSDILELKSVNEIYIISMVDKIYMALPTSSSGLTSGGLWNNSGVVNIV